MVQNMRVAVITPYHKEPTEMLLRAHQSVINQQHPATHFLVADGHPNQEIANWNAQHIILPQEHSNNGNTPRCVGAIAAIAQDFDAIAFLDADNWFLPHHIQLLIQHHKQSGAAIVASGRNIYDMDGNFLCPGDENDGSSHCDTSAFLLTRAAYDLIPAWGLMPNQLSPLCDAIFFDIVKSSKHSFSYNPVASLCFTSRYHLHFLRVGKEVPAYATNMAAVKRGNEFWSRVNYPDRQKILSMRAVDLSHLRGKYERVEITGIFDPERLSQFEQAFITALGLGDDHRIKLNPMQVEASPLAIGNLCRLAIEQPGPGCCRIVMLPESWLPDYEELLLPFFVNKLDEPQRLNAHVRPLLLKYVPDNLAGYRFNPNTMFDNLSWRIVAGKSDIRPYYVNGNYYGDAALLAGDRAVDVAGQLLRDIKNELLAEKE